VRKRLGDLAQIATGFKGTARSRRARHEAECPPSTSGARANAALRDQLDRAAVGDTEEA
jgi:hypothetical protein